MTITVLEFTPNQGAGITTLGVTKTCSEGSTVVVFAYNSSTAYTLSCTIGGTAGTAIETTTGNDKVQSWYRENVPAGSITVTVTEIGPNSTGIHLQAVELTGVPTSAVYDDSGFQAQTVTTLYGADSPGTNISAGSVALAHFFCDRSTTLTISGWAALTATTGELHAKLYYKEFASAATGERATASPSPNAYATGTLAAFKVAAGGGSSVGAGLGAGILTGGRLFNGLRG